METCPFCEAGLMENNDASNVSYGDKVYICLTEVVAHGGYKRGYICYETQIIRFRQLLKKVVGLLRVKPDKTSVHWDNAVAIFLSHPEIKELMEE